MCLIKRIDRWIINKYNYIRRFYIMNNKRFAIVVLLFALVSLCLAAINLNNSLNLVDKKD